MHACSAAMTSRSPLAPRPAALMLALASALLAAGCAPAAPEQAPPAGAGTPDAARGGALHVTAALQQKWGITTAPPERRSDAVAVTLPGVLRLDERRTAQVTSLVDGQVASIAADLGTPVRQGQVLATIHAPALAEAKTDFLQAAARAELTRREAERARVLLEREAIDRKEADRRQADDEQARTNYGVAESRLHSYGLDQEEVDALLRRARHTADGSRHDDLADPRLRVLAPLAGRIIARDVLLGQHVTPAIALFTVSDVATLWAVLDAREPDLPFVSPGRAVRIRSSVYIGRTWDGRVLHVGDVVDEKSRTVKVRVEVPNAGLLLKPNMFVQGEVVGASGTREVLTVPDGAVQTVNGETVVFVRAAPDRFALRAVQAGGRTGDRRTILDGLDGTEQVVVTGAFSLKAELLKSSLAGE